MDNSEKLYATHALLKVYQNNWPEDTAGRKGLNDAINKKLGFKFPLAQNTNSENGILNALKNSQETPYNNLNNQILMSLHNSRDMA